MSEDACAASELGAKLDQAQAVMLRINASEPKPGTELRVWAEGQSMPKEATIVFNAGGLNTVPSLVVPLQGAGLRLQASDSLEVSVDVVGYFDAPELQAEGASSVNPSEAKAKGFTPTADGSFDNLAVAGGLSMTSSSSKFIMGTQGNLTFQALNDVFGSVKMSLQNRFGVNGVLYEQNDVSGIVDFVLRSAGVQRNVRLEDRDGSQFLSAYGPEFQFGQPAGVGGGPNFVVADSRALFRGGSVGVVAQNSDILTNTKFQADQASTAGAAYAVVGRITSTSPGGSSAAVRGINNGTGGSGIGVYGSQAGSGYGVYGTAVNGLGVYGFASGANGYGGYFSNNADGIALYATGSGIARNAATLRINNSEPAGGMASYFTTSSTYANSHFANGGVGEVFYLENGGTDAAGTGGGDFIKAMNNPESDTQFVVTTAGKVLADSILKVGTDISSGDTQSYSSFGTGTKGETSIDNENDVFISGALEVGNNLYIGNSIYIGDAASTGATDNILITESGDDVWIERDLDSTQTNSWFRIFTNGTGFEQFRIDDGDEAAIKGDGTFTSNGIDYAEAFRVKDQTLEAGDVVVLNLKQSGYVQRSKLAYAANLAGVVSGKPGFLTGQSFNAEEQADPATAELRRQAHLAGNREAEKQYTLQLEEKVRQQYRAVALVGRVPVKVDGAYGAIRPGDRLTSSATPGHAMLMQTAGPSIGIALEGWSGTDRGQIMVFIQPSWWDPQSSAPIDE